jgi:serine/threonine protein kinase
MLPSETPEEAVDLLSKFLKYTPESRLSGFEAMCHPFFDELRVESQKMPNGQDLPPLFDFTREGTTGSFLLDVLTPDPVSQSCVSIPA